MIYGSIIIWSHIFFNSMSCIHLFNWIFVVFHTSQNTFSTGLLYLCVLHQSKQQRLYIQRNIDFPEHCCFMALIVFECSLAMKWYKTINSYGYICAFGYFMVFVSFHPSLVMTMHVNHNRHKNIATKVPYNQYSTQQLIHFLSFILHNSRVNTNNNNVKRTSQIGY